MGDFVIESFGSKFSLSENPVPCPVSLSTVQFFGILGLIGFTSTLVLPMVQWIEENVTPKLRVILPYYVVIGETVKSTVQTSLMRQNIFGRYRRPYRLTVLKNTFLTMGTLASQRITRCQKEIRQRTFCEYKNVQPLIWACIRTCMSDELCFG